MGVNCMSARMPRGCHCPACPRAEPPQSLVLPPMASEPEVTPKKASKMKVLKKIKKKMGLAPRAPCAGGAPNNLPPLCFHRVHGENIRLSRDGSLARRVESFCKGVTFSNRPVRVNEKVCLRFAEISNNWSGVLRFGFTSHDPALLAGCLPKYACPDLTNKPGYWAKALAERFCEKDNVLFYYVTPAGDVHFGINGEEKGVFFSGVETRGVIWALLDVYANCTGVQFCDPRAPNRRSLVASDAELTTSLRSLSIEEQLPPPRFEQAVQPLVLHRMRGRNIRQITDGGVAARIETEFCQGYVFTARPMRPGETIVVQILATENAYAGSLAIGLTSCDPATLRPSELPDDAESLLDRPEYWVVRRDAANGMRRGDEMSVTLTVDGEVRVSRNGSPPATVMHVDHTLRLWAFVDVYGATQKVRLLGTTAPPPPPTPPGLRVRLGSAAPAPGGTVLVVSLPPQHPGAQPLALAGAHYIEPMSSQPQLCLPLPQWQEAHCASTSQNNVNNQTLSEPNPGTSLAPSPGERLHYQHLSAQVHPSIQQMAPHQMHGMHQPVYSVIGEQIGTIGGAGAECTICYENPIDSVLYTCGHMCMCYRCAVQQWRGKGGGQCPLCRARIRDVIRTYKS